jgi:hypothetical protein
MGKLLPFKKVPLSADAADGVHGSCKQTQAEALISEAADLLAKDKTSDSAVTWILEDCLDLLRTTQLPRSTEDKKVDPDTLVKTGVSQDPRLLLKPDSEITTIVRKK